jgi:hypothetical protein
VRTDNQTAAGETLRALFDAALAAAEPFEVLERRIRLQSEGARW